MRTYEWQTHAGTVAIRCLLCGRISELPGDVANRYCGRCHLFHDVVAEGLRLVAYPGATHECSEWQTGRGVCALCGPPMLTQGARVWITLDGQTAVAACVLASAFGDSAALVFDGIVGGYTSGMPITWDREGKVYRDLFKGRALVVTPYPS
jgi:hypothetical protein